MITVGRSGSPAATLLFTVAVGGCPPSPPVVTEIEVVPAKVAVAADATQPTTFVLEARLWSGPGGSHFGIAESQGVSVKWSLSTSSAGVQIVGITGYRATLRVDPGNYPSSTVSVKAEAGTLWAESKIVNSATSGEDAIEASYGDGQIPDAVVVRGVRTDSDRPCALWLAPSLVRAGNAGSVKDVCPGAADWNVAVLDPAHAMMMYRTNFTAGLDKASTPTPSAIRSLPVAVRVFIGDGPDLASRQNETKLFAKNEIADANTTVFADNRAGIELVLVDDVQIVPAPATETTVSDCTAGDNLTRGYDYDAPPNTSRSAVLHVYFVDEPGGVDGFTCPGSKEHPQPVIYVRAAKHSGTILLHEVGHALGLDLPGMGHSSELSGFDVANVMMRGYSTSDPIWRRRFTVGQVLRMNADSASWLNWAKTLTGGLVREDAQPRIHCQCGGNDPADSLCPRIIDDVARPRGSVGTLQDWHCGDLVKLPVLEDDEKPMALIAGRRWRTPPTECPQYLVGHWFTHDQADFIQPDDMNLTRAAGCPSWIAVFFKNHAPRFRQSAAVDGAWSDAYDLRLMTDALDSPRTVTVHVHYSNASYQDVSEAKSGITEAKQVFGTDNRTGLELTLSEEPAASVPNPCPPPPTGELAVCYSVGGHSVARLIGAALLLPELSTSEQGDAAFAHNVMQPVLAAGVKPKLTLGQIFRIHSELVKLTLPTEFPPCPSTGPGPPTGPGPSVGPGPPTDQCPPLSAGVQP